MTYFKTKSVQRLRLSLYESAVQGRFHKGVRKAGIVKRANSHTVPESLATHPLEWKKDIGIVQELPRRANIITTMVYAHS